jgi:hypothetical protein
MMIAIPCPHLHAAVELTDERRQHILDKHPEIMPDHFDQIAETIADPDEIQQDERFANTYHFSRRYEAIEDGKYLIVVVVTDLVPATRHWIVTAYLSRRVRKGVAVWKRN